MCAVMNSVNAWKNFNLGQELSISGNFIYSGLRLFHEMRSIDNADEIFEFLYNISVGIERLLKVAVVLLEHNDSTNQEDLEKSLITHNHLELLRRVKQHKELPLGNSHNEFLGLLGTFYKTVRYDRFSISSLHRSDKERETLCGFLNKYLQIGLDPSSSDFGILNDAKYKKFVRKIVIKISGSLYDIIQKSASDLNLYTCEFRHGSKAETVFLSKADLPSEDVLWKELLIFFMNTKVSSKYLEFLRSIDPLDFDPELTDEYLDCFQSDASKAFVMGELECLYGELTEPGARLKKMDIIGNPDVVFYSPVEDD